jgi:hypothetical protein
MDVAICISTIEALASQITNREVSRQQIRLAQRQPLLSSDE